MSRPLAPTFDIDVANDPRYVLDPQERNPVVAHDLDDDDDEIDFDADDRHNGVRRGFDPEAA